MTPREVRTKLNEIDKWVHSNKELLSPDDQVLAFDLLECAYLERHLKALQAWLRETMEGKQ